MTVTAMDAIFMRARDQFEKSWFFRLMVGMFFFSTVLMLLLSLPGQAEWANSPFIFFYCVSAGTFLSGLRFALHELVA